MRTSKRRAAVAAIGVLAMGVLAGCDEDDLRQAGKSALCVQAKTAVAGSNVSAATYKGIAAEIRKASDNEHVISLAQRVENSTTDAQVREYATELIDTHCGD